MEHKYLKLDELEVGKYYTCRLSDREVVVTEIGRCHKMKMFVDLVGFESFCISDYQLYVGPYQK